MNYCYSPYGISIKRNAMNRTHLLTEDLKTAIKNELLHAGDLLLSHRKLNRFSGLGINIIRNAYKNLENQGYVTVEPQKGTIVSLDLKYLSPGLAPKVIFESDTVLNPINKVIPLKGKPMEYMQIGRDGMNPAPIVQNKPNAFLEIFNKEYDKSFNVWQEYRAKEEEFKEVIRRKLMIEFNVVFHHDQITWNNNRVVLYNDLFKIVFQRGDIVILSSNADRELTEQLSLHGVRLIYMTTSVKGFCLNELKAIIDYQKKIGDPVKTVFSNPYQESFSNLVNIDIRRQALFSAVQQWGILLIEEFAQSEYIRLKDRVKWNEGERHVHYYNIILIGKLSSLYSGMQSVQTLIASEKIITDFQRQRSRVIHGLLPSYAVYRRVIMEGILANHKKNILHKLDGWRKQVQEAASKKLSPWFELKEGSGGVSFWLKAKNKEGIKIPYHAMREVPIDVYHSSHEDEAEVLVHALKVCIGYGNTDRIGAVFQLLNKYLTKRYPVLTGSIV